VHLNIQLLQGSAATDSATDPGFANGGQTMGSERAERESKWESGEWGPGALSPGGRSVDPVAKSFLSIFIQKWP